ncbi:MAG: DUF5658 family protein [Pseudomonadota bacterium]
MDTQFDLTQEPDRRSEDRRMKTRFFNKRHLGIGARRRSGGRRRYDPPQYVDWYESDLMVMALGIVVLSLADAFITLRLLDMGAIEANVLMARLIEQDVHTFVALKIALTGLTIVLLVVHKNFRFIQMISVKTLIWVFLGLYMALIAYELALLQLIPKIENPSNFL